MSQASSHGENTAKCWFRSFWHSPLNCGRDRACFLQDAVRDLLYFKERNDELELKLKKAAEWELDIR